jgi:hypothetical protein
LEPLDAMGKIRRDGEHLVMAFGRHRGRYLKEVQANDPGYIGWLLNDLECESTKDDIKQHLNS